LRYGEVSEPKMVWAAATAKVVVVVLSPEYISRVWTLKELEVALARCGDSLPRQESARRFRDGTSFKDFLGRKLDLLKQVEPGDDGFAGEIYPVFFQLFPTDCDDLDAVLDRNVEVASRFGKWSLHPERKLYPDRWKAALAHLSSIGGPRYQEESEDYKNFAKRIAKMIRKRWFPGRAVRRTRSRFDSSKADLLDEKIREEIPTFLELPNEIWRGVYPPLRRGQCDILQFCIQREPGDDLIIMGNMNLRDFVVDDLDGQEVLNAVIETDENLAVRWLSSTAGTFEGLQELIEVINERLQAERRTPMVDLLARKRELVQIKAAQFIQKVLPLIRKHEKAIVAALAATLHTDRTPAHLFIIAGVEYADLRATAELRTSSDFIAENGNAVTGRTIPDYSVTEDAATAFQLMKFNLEGHDSIHQDSRHRPEIPTGGDDCLVPESEGEDSGTTGGSCETSITSIGRGRSDRGSQYARSVCCWRVGAQATLDETDQLTCSRPMLCDTSLLPKRHPQLVIELYRIAADEGHLLSIHKLGLCYLDGIGVEQDIFRAVALFERAAERGHTGSIYKFGWCLEKGLGVERNLTRAAELFHLGADMGDLESSYRLALLKSDGHGIEKDLAGAYETLTYLANKGHIKGLNLLAHYVLCGVGSQSAASVTQAEKILRKALQCEPENVTSIFMLAHILVSFHDEVRLQEARNVLVPIPVDSHCYQRAKWLIGFIDDQLVELKYFKQTVQPNPSFISALEVQFVALIGTGRCAKVFLAHYRKRWVAVKYSCVTPNNGDAGVTRNFFRERSACQRISAAELPGVVKYLGCVLDHLGDSQPGLMFELCADISAVEAEATSMIERGVVATRFTDIGVLPDWSDRVESSLRSHVVFVVRQQWPAHRVVGMLRQVAESLLALHKLGFLHRDVADRNVLCDADGNVKLSDFQLAKLAGSGEDDSQPLAQYEKYLTPGHQYAIAWWAPECVRVGDDGRRATFSTMSDVYSFGILLWQCFAHRDPFDDVVYSRRTGNGVAETIAARILDGDRPDLSCLDKHTPNDLKNLMESCWESDPAVRPGLDSVVQELARIETLPWEPVAPKIHNRRDMAEKWFNVSKMYLSLPVAGLSGKEKSSSESSNRSSNGLRDRRPYDVFLVHTGRQKIEVATMKDFLESGNFHSFFDREMRPSADSPTEQMKYALETCRHPVVVISRDFLAKRVPWNELVYCFNRMEWVRKYYKNWGMPLIVLYDLSISEYNNACASSSAPVPDIATDTVLLVWSNETTWSELCQKVKVRLDQLDDRGAIQEWNEFLTLGSHSISGDPFPTADSVYK